MMEKFDEEVSVVQTINDYIARGSYKKTTRKFSFNLIFCYIWNFKQIGKWNNPLQSHYESFPWVCEFGDRF